MTEQEFWGLGLSEYGALVKRFNAQERRADYRALLVACTIINVIWKPDPPVTPEDYLQPAQPKVQTPEEQLLVLKAVNAIYGGQVVTKGGEK